MDEKSMETESPEKNYNHLRIIQQHFSNPSSSSSSSGDGSGGSSSPSGSGCSGGNSGCITSSSGHSRDSRRTHFNNNSIAMGGVGLNRDGVINIQISNRQSLPRAMDDGALGMSSSGSSRDSGNGSDNLRGQRPSRACPSPVSSIVGTALNQLHLKRSSSAPMINQLGLGPAGRDVPGMSSSIPSSGLANASSDGCAGGVSKDAMNDIDASSLANSYLSSLGGPRPRRFSASFSPGSPGPAPNRVSQLRQENTTDWETVSEKEFHGTVGIAQSWEDLSLDSMSMEIGTRRPSISDQLWLSMPPTSSAPSSPAASPRVLSRFSPSLSSPSPTRKSFTTRRSLSPIAVRPSVLSIGHGVKRKCDWDSSNSSNQMDCSPQPAKRPGGLLGFNQGGSPLGSPYNNSVPYVGVNFSSTGNSHQQFFPGIHNQSHHGVSPFNPNNSSISSGSLMFTNQDSPYSNETESSVSSIGGCDSPFFRPVDSPLASVTTSPEDSPHPPLPKI